MNFNIDDELGQQFNEYVIKRYGYKKGNKKKAAEEAIRRWIAAIDIGCEEETEDYAKRPKSPLDPELEARRKDYNAHHPAAKKVG